MSGSFPGFGSRPGGQGSGLPGSLWDAMDQLKDAFERGFSPRVGRGDVRTAVLAILTEEPMHGYQIILALFEARSNGMWKPSPGSVYPTLQVLADEGLVTAVESAGKKTYSLTDACNGWPPSMLPWTPSPARGRHCGQAGRRALRRDPEGGRTARPGRGARWRMRGNLRRTSPMRSPRSMRRGASST